MTETHAEIEQHRKRAMGKLQVQPAPKEWHQRFVERMQTIAMNNSTALDDGFLYYFPPSGGGCYSATTLRLIADWLDEQNGPMALDMGEGREAAQ